MKLLIVLLLVRIASASDQYIIGGKVADIGRWPWQGSLQAWGRHNCGITLIAARWGVTVAHCVEDTSKLILSFRFGSNEVEAGGQVVRAANVIMHENYGTGSGAYPNDIAVIEFSTDVDVANAVPIDMADSSTDHAHEEGCVITGWGYTAWPSTDIPRELHEAEIDVYSNNYCEEFWGININDGHVCIGADGKGACTGDSGGPLVCPANNTNNFVLVGLTSWGASGCPTYTPSVYCRIAFFRDWIKEKTGI